LGDDDAGKKYRYIDEIVDEVRKRVGIQTQDERQESDSGGS